MISTDAPHSDNSNNKLIVIAYKGFTLVELVVTMIIMAILMYVGGNTLSLKDTSAVAYRIEAERIVNGIKWAQHYAISHSCTVTMSLTGDKYRIYQGGIHDYIYDYNYDKIIRWPLAYSNCSDNLCTLRSGVLFLADVALELDADGSVTAYNIKVSKEGSLNFEPINSSTNNQSYSIYQVFIPVINVTKTQDMQDILYIVISTISGMIKLLKGNNMV